MDLHHGGPCRSNALLPIPLLLLVLCLLLHAQNEGPQQRTRFQLIQDCPAFVLLFALRSFIFFRLEPAVLIAANQPIRRHLTVGPPLVPLLEDLVDIVLAISAGDHLYLGRQSCQFASLPIAFQPAIALLLLNGLLLTLFALAVLGFITCIDLGFPHAKEQPLRSDNQVVVSEEALPVRGAERPHAFQLLLVGEVQLRGVLDVEHPLEFLDSPQSGIPVRIEDCSHAGLLVVEEAVGARHLRPAGKRGLDALFWRRGQTFQNDLHALAKSLVSQVGSGKLLLDPPHQRPPSERRTRRKSRCRG